jgi:hypothetical protein
MTRSHLLSLDIDPQDGTIRLPNGVVIGAGMTQDAFRAGAIFGEAQSDSHGTLPWITYRIPGGDFDGKALLISPCFYDQMLVSVDLTADLYPPGPKSWSTYSDEIEAATESFHDRLLEHFFAASTRGESFDVNRLSGDKAPRKDWSFPWGQACSTHDPRGDGTFITVSYGNRQAEAAKAYQAGSAAVTSKIVESVVNDTRFAGDLQRAKVELELGNRIAAIRLAREATGMSLREAQDLVAQWERKA